MIPHEQEIISDAQIYNLMSTKQACNSREMLPVTIHGTSHEMSDLGH